MKWHLAGARESNMRSAAQTHYSFIVFFSIQQPYKLQNEREQINWLTTDGANMDMPKNYRNAEHAMENQVENDGSGGSSSGPNGYGWFE